MSKTDTAMANESLCKLLCLNLTCPIQEQETLGIVPIFWKDEEKYEFPAVLPMVRPGSFLADVPTGQIKAKEKKSGMNEIGPLTAALLCERSAIWSAPRGKAASWPRSMRACHH